MSSANECATLVMEKTVKEFQPQSVEKELRSEAVRERAKSAAIRVCATDRAPKPEEYKYVCQGIPPTVSSAVIFTILYNESGKVQVRRRRVAALEALQVHEERLKAAIEAYVCISPRRALT